MRLTSRLAAIAALAAVYVAAARLGLSARISAPERDTGVAADRHRPGRSPAVGLPRLAGSLRRARSRPTCGFRAPCAPSLGIAVRQHPGSASSGAWLVNRFAGGRHAFERPRDIFRFAGLAAMAATADQRLGRHGRVSCLGGLARWADFAPIGLTWWLGDASGALLVTPVLLTWLPDSDRRAPRPADGSRRRCSAAVSSPSGGRFRRTDSHFDHGPPARVSVPPAARGDRVPARNPRGGAGEPAAGGGRDRLHASRDGARSTGPTSTSRSCSSRPSPASWP